MNRTNQLRQEEKKQETKVSKDRESGVKVIRASQISMDKRKLMEERSKNYIYIMSDVDDEKDEVVEKIVKQMPLRNKLIGILAECKIPGCIIHAVDKEGNILEHYQTEDDIPEELLEGYQVYLENKGCMTVEVYTLYFCVVNPNGTVKFIERNSENNRGK